MSDPREDGGSKIYEEVRWPNPECFLTDELYWPSTHYKVKGHRLQQLGGWKVRQVSFFAD